MPNRRMARPVYGLVLAGGKSRRMGRDKAKLMRGEESQLAYVVNLLEALLERVFVSTRAEQSDDSERGRFPQIVDRFDDMGPVAGILSAMEEYPDADWLVVACDLPNIDEATVAYLLEHRSVDKPFTAFSSTHDGLPEPLCAVYASDSVDIVRAFVAEGVCCPRKILIRSDSHLLSQPNPSSLDNVNTPDDLQGSVLAAS